MSPLRAVVAAGPRATEAALFAALERLAPADLEALGAAPGPLRVVVPSGSLRVHLLAELARRRAAWTQPAPRYTRGVLAKFAKNACSASGGAVLDRF